MVEPDADETCGRDIHALAVPGARAAAAYYALSRVLFWFVYRVLGLRRSVTVDNLRRSFPELDERALQTLRRDFIERQSEIFAEIIYGSRVDADELRQRVRIIHPRCWQEPPRHGR